jgi:hypothetical protein
MPRGRPKGQRQTTASTFIRLTDDEMDLIERALARQAEGVIGADKITVAAFARAVALREAKKILGEK